MKVLNLLSVKFCFTFHSSTSHVSFNTIYFSRPVFSINDKREKINQTKREDHVDRMIENRKTKKIINYCLVGKIDRDRNMWHHLIFEGSWIRRRRDYCCYTLNTNVFSYYTRICFPSSVLLIFFLLLLLLLLLLKIILVSLSMDLWKNNLCFLMFMLWQSFPRFSVFSVLLLALNN